MIGPKRLIEEGSAFDRALLRAGREDRPSRDYARRVVAAAALVSPATGALPTSMLGRLARLRWVAPFALGTGAAVLAVMTLPIGDRPSPIAPLANAPPAPIEMREEVPAPREVLPVTTPDALPNAAPSAAPPPVRERRAAPARAIAPPPVATNELPASEPSEPSDKGASLQREVELLDAVKKSLRAGATSDAESALMAYDAEFPAGSLKPEAGFLHVRVLLAKGDRARAVALGDELLARHPNTVHAKRIRALLAP